MGYDAFQATAAGRGTSYECRFHTLATGISPRHSDTVDVKFLVGGRVVVIALPHAAFAAHRLSAGHPLTDRQSIEIAGRLLKGFLERGLWSGEEELRPSEMETTAAIQMILT